MENPTKMDDDGYPQDSGNLQMVAKNNNPNGKNCRQQRPGSMLALWPAEVPSHPKRVHIMHGSWKEHQPDRPSST